MVIYNIQDYGFLFLLCPSSGILLKKKNIAFQKLDLFPSSGDGGSKYPVGSVRKTSD
jgi:hypothetical protein